MKDYDPYMHTTEHILNRTMINMFGCERSFTNHLERKKSKCDYHFPRSLTTAEEKIIESKINEQLAQNLDVTEIFLTRDEAMLQCNLDRLPNDAGENVRLILVGDYDICPCIGSHVANTSEIGRFVFGSSTFEDGVLRIRFKLNKK